MCRGRVKEEVSKSKPSPTISYVALVQLAGVAYVFRCGERGGLEKPEESLCFVGERSLAVLLCILRHVPKAMQVDRIGQKFSDGACHSSVGVRDDQLQYTERRKGAAWHNPERLPTDTERRGDHA